MVDAAPDALCGVASVASVALGVQREVNEAGIVGGDGWRGGGRGGGGEGRGGEGRGGGELTLSHIIIGRTIHVTERVLLVVKFLPRLELFPLLQTDGQQQVG